MSQDTRESVARAVDDFVGGLFCGALMMGVFLVFFVVLPGLR